MRIRVAPIVRCAVGCLVGSLVLTPDSARAQGTIVRGVVVDSAGKPVSEVALGIVALHHATRTDEQGHFAFPALPKGDVEVSVRRIGYEPIIVRFVVSGGPADSIRVVLAELPQVMEAVSVSAAERHRLQRIEDFYWRRARGIGTYFTREEMLSRRASVPSDVLRTAKGIRFVRTAGGGGIRFSSATNMRTPCAPMIWIDGQRAPGMEIDEIPLNDIEGIELYNGASTTPPEFWQANAVQCGTIVVWSRLPGGS
jgi:carboxypeptidase family protein/TonB-dependent receptor-like protein